MAIAYLENVLTYSKNRKECCKYIREVLKYLSRIRLLLKLEKYEFYKKLIEFFRFWVITSEI